MNTENTNVIPNSNDPPSVTEHIIDGQKFTVTRYFSSNKNLEEQITELAYRQADREFNLNMPKDLKS